MDWARDYYTAQSRTFASGALTDAHAAIAARIDGWVRSRASGRRALELGAGAGGVAVAMAELGWQVTAVDFNSSDTALARTLVAERRLEASVRVVEADFYAASFSAQFDLVYYWDGFGIGTDLDQRRLLQRVASEWLAPGGVLLLDVFSPWQWHARAGEQLEYTARDGTTWHRTVGYDVLGQRMVDTWRPATGGPTRSQTIRCYSIPDLELLIDGTGLVTEATWLPDGTPVDAHSGPALDGTNGFVTVLRKRS